MYPYQMLLLIALLRTTRIWGSLHCDIPTAETEAQVHLASLCQNMISVLFMVEMCDVIRPGTQHDQKYHEVRFGIQYCILITKRVKAV